MSVVNVISSVLGRAAGSVATLADTGVATIAIRDDVLSTLSVSESEYTQLRVDSQGALHVTHAAGDGGAVTNAGTFAVQESGAALTHLATLAGAVTSSVVQTSALVTERGSEGNLFSAQVITAPYTNSAAVDVSASSRCSILIKGNAPSATEKFDVFLSSDSTNWTLVASYLPLTVDGNNGLALTDRQGLIALDVAGVSFIKLQAHASETVTASCFSN